jgi:DNA-binding winged helix-turn-helix (wHTH) protein
VIAYRIWGFDDRLNVLGLLSRSHIDASKRTPAMATSGWTSDPAEPEIAFGPFRLLQARRLLLRGNEPVPVGGRAFDLLIALVERPGEVVSKSELIAEVWPETFVAEGNLKVRIAALRRALADDQGGDRYISTIVGRGYCFVAQVTRSSRRDAASRRCGGARVRGARRIRLARRRGAHYRRHLPEA